MQTSLLALGVEDITIQDVFDQVEKRKSWRLNNLLGSALGSNGLLLVDGITIQRDIESEELRKHFTSPKESLRQRMPDEAQKVSVGGFLGLIDYGEPRRENQDHMLAILNNDVLPRTMREKAREKDGVVVFDVASAPTPLYVPFEALVTYFERHIERGASVNVFTVSVPQK